MKLRKILFVVGLMAIFAMLTPGLQVWAGGPEPPAGSTIHGPEVWGVVVLNCNAGPVTLRVKRIVNCVVETQAIIQSDWIYGCSDDPTAPLDLALEGITFFPGSLPEITGTPFITKVKNYKREGDIISFDAQFKFYE